MVTDKTGFRQDFGNVGREKKTLITIRTGARTRRDLRRQHARHVRRPVSHIIGKPGESMPFFATSAQAGAHHGYL
jgi:hypothetical protein